MSTPRAGAFVSLWLVLGEGICLFPDSENGWNVTWFREFLPSLYVIELLVGVSRIWTMLTSYYVTCQSFNIRIYIHFYIILNEDQMRHLHVLYLKQKNKIFSIEQGRDDSQTNWTFSISIKAIYKCAIEAYIYKQFFNLCLKIDLTKKYININVYVSLD